jgi:hypothetical protein
VDTVPILFGVEALGMGAVEVDVDAPSTATSSASVVFSIATDSGVSIVASWDLSIGIKKCEKRKAAQDYRATSSILLWVYLAGEATIVGGKSG